MTKKYKIVILIAILLCAVTLIWFSLFRKAPIVTPVDNSISGIVSDIRQHALPALDIQLPASSTSFWVTSDGYMAIVPDQSALRSYIRNPQDINALMDADQELTGYATKRLESAGYQPDPDNSSTSTNNDPFYILRIAFVSSSGTSRCLIEPPDPTQSQIQISWYFDCVNTQDIQAAIQSEKPFLDALGDLKGAAVTNIQQGNFAAVGVSGEVLGYFRAIMMKSGKTWTVLYKGQGSPSCSLMQQYGVPVSIYGQCQ